MSTQSESNLEKQLVEQLVDLGYSKVSIPNEKALLENLKVQLEKHNNIELSATEFERVLNILNKGSIFEKAKTLREKQLIIRDNGDNLYFEFLNTEYWCQNQYQVTQQVTIQGKYTNRYDVTLLINGLPLVQIELKKRGLGLKEAFKQINRYQSHSYGENKALFQYVQLFVISNGVDTKYYANNKALSFKQTFFWTDRENKRLTNLHGFTSDFLEPCHLSKMICRYIVLNETHKVLMALRPYQFYAVENIVQTVKESNKNGYIWHTTGSGKTLTSFKASQILSKLPEVKKVVFVVDRKDLDHQTSKEFNSFSKGSIDGTNNTHALVKQLEDETKIIVTTIQKLNNAISKDKYSKKIERLKKEKVVFIFDECHRSQFGETHKKITSFFENIQMFGFTGTPILEKNHVKNDYGKRTTKELFGEALHKYVITDAIRDENVLKFSVEYIGRYKEKESSNKEIDVEVENIDTKEFMESTERIEKIVDFIIRNHDRKTHDKKFSAMLCVGSVDALITYYDLFQKKKENKEHDLRIATIFSYDANSGFDNDEQDTEGSDNTNIDKKDKLEKYIQDYNKLFKTEFTTKDTESFYKYYNDISDKLKKRENSPENTDNRIDILLVVNMFLTGFDAKKINTLYVDKNLQYQGLIQAYSRTNRILDEMKSHGNIVVFRNLKQATDEAISLFSNKEAIEDIMLKPYEDYVPLFNSQYQELLKIAPNVDAVNELVSEDEELEFIKAFRNLMRTRNRLVGFSDFSWDNLEMTEQDFEDYKSKYLNLYDKSKNSKRENKASIIEDIDFEVELIQRDEINVDYILQLLMSIQTKTDKEQQEAIKQVLNLLGSEVNLRSKKKLIEKFIAQNMHLLSKEDDMREAFEFFKSKEQKLALEEIIETENLSYDRTIQLIEHCAFSQKEPLSDELIELIEGEKPSLLQRKAVKKRLLDKINSYLSTFE